MNSFDEKRYLIDNEPASARDVINLAKEIDTDYAKSQLQQTSVAANILRIFGYEVAVNKDLKER